MTTNERLSSIPQVEKVLAQPAVEAYAAMLSRPLAARLVSRVLAHERAKAMKDPTVPVDAQACLRACVAALGRTAMKRFHRVVNGTGIILHTNLGRSPIPADAWDRAREANVGYAPVELQLDSGKRGGRGGLANLLAAELAGAESAAIVNNNAAAVLLALTAIAKGKEVIVARGEQVQIGGGFRVPDILELAGARFVEVGTTNIVTAEDYRRAVGPDTACALSVHSSNFAIRGFSSRPSTAELVRALGPNVPLLVDQGSGCTTEAIPGETPMRAFLKAGASLVCFSGDKLLGGPQAGILAGKASLIEAITGHPLYRAFRPGKTIYSLLEAVLVDRLNGDEGPAAKARKRPIDELKKLARRIKGKLPKASCQLEDSQAASGGGTGPDETFPSVALALDSPLKADQLATLLRRAPYPVLALVRDGKVLVDMAAVLEDDAAPLAESLSWALERARALTEAKGAEGPKAG